MEIKYYKISPEWAAKLNITETAPKHPDGWHLVTPSTAIRLIDMLPPKEDGERLTTDEAIKYIGGCIYTEEQAHASQRGDESYRMDKILSETIVDIEPKTE